jgi:hypothetical protein
VLEVIDLKGVHRHGRRPPLQKAAATIVAKGGDYCFTLKGSQDSLLSDAANAALAS